MTTQAVAARDPLLSLLSSEPVKKRFEQLMGGRGGAAFISSIIAAVNNSSALSEIAQQNPKSIIAAGVMAATINLPVTPGLGWAAIVPYKGNAQFQIMKDGYVQLAMRTGQYRAISCSDVYEDELDGWNPHAGEFVSTDPETWSQRAEGKLDKIVGYMAFFKLLNGFEKYSFWTIAQLEAHGKKYSQSYKTGKGLWIDNKPAMYLKTPLKLLLQHFGPLSTAMQYAFEYDQAIRKPSGETDYPDGRQVVDTFSTKPLIAEPKSIEEKESPKPRGRPSKTKKPDETQTAAVKEEEVPKDSESKKTENLPPIPEGWNVLSSARERSCSFCAELIREGELYVHDPDYRRLEHRRHYA
jgi:recombination protein RecT